MKRIKLILVALILLANLVFAQPSLADKPKFLKNPDYIEVTKALDELSAVKDAQAQAGESTPAEVQQKIDELEFQKYALETGVSWGQCRNETGKTLAVYGPKPDLDDDDFDYSYENGLYFLADGQTTKKKWDCEGVYLPSGIKTAGLSADEQGQDLTGPVAVKVVDGTQLVIKTNSDTGAIEFNVPTAKVIKPGEANWFIPNIGQATIDTRVANAPVAKPAKETNLVVMTPQKDSAESKTPTEAQPQPQSQPQAQSQPESDAKSVSPKTGYFKKL